MKDSRDEVYDYNHYGSEPHCRKCNDARTPPAEGPSLVLEYGGKRALVLADVGLDDLDSEHGRRMILEGLNTAMRELLGVSDE